MILTSKGTNHFRVPFHLRNTFIPSLYLTSAIILYSLKVMGVLCHFLQTIQVKPIIKLLMSLPTSLSHLKYS